MAVQDTQRRRIGQYLDCGEEAMSVALAEQSREKRGAGRRLLGQILLDQGVICEGQRAAALREQRADTLRGCSLFADVPPDRLHELADNFREITAQAGDLLIQQDSRDTSLYVVASGFLEVYRTGDELSKEIKITTVQSGEPIGEMAYFSNGVRSASVRAVELSHLLQVDFSVLTFYFDELSGLAGTFLRVATDRLRQTNLLFQEAQSEKLLAEQTIHQLGEFLDGSTGQALADGIEGLIKRVVSTASRLVNAERASLFLIDPVTGELWSKVAEGNEIREIRVQKGTGVIGWVAENRETINIDDAYADFRFNPAVDKRTGFHTRNILCGPVWGLKNELLGVIQTINKRTGAFDAQDEMLFRAFAHQAAVSVENFNLYRKMVLGHDRMAVMLDIATSINQTLELGPLIGRIVQKTTEALNCERSAFFVLDREQDELWSMQAHGAELKEIRFPATAGLAGDAATRGEIVNVPDAYTDERFNPEIDKRTGFRTSSVLCVPVLGRDGAVLGVSQAINKHGGAFDGDDVELLRAISSQIAMTLQNAQLYASTVRMKEYLENVQESISNGILTLDDDYRLVTINRAAGKLFALDRKRAQGVSQQEFFADQNPALFELLEQTRTQGNGASYLDLEVCARGGEKRTVNASAFPLSDENDRQNGLILVLDDLTREKRVRSTLTRYMAKDIVDRMLSDPDQQALGGVRGKATILFSDIRGFTTISEALSAEQTMDFLNEYFSMMVDEVFSHHGVLDKFIGDALMAVFGIPYAQDDDALRAVHTALAMKRSLARYNRLRRERGQPAVRIGIGINTGEVISGNMGSAKRMDYTVIGDGVNVSSRVEGLNKQYGTDILVTEFTRRDLKDEFNLLPVDYVRVQGKVRPIRVYAVLGEAGEGESPAIECFRQGMLAYEGRDFVKAFDLFRELYGSLEVGRVYGERCQQLMIDPPPDDWDGVWMADCK